MKEQESTTSAISSSIRSLLEILFTVFLVLKLTGLIDWPWIWVLCPIWIPIALFVIVLVIYLIIKEA